jgi:hypothetical protein
MYFLTVMCYNYKVGYFNGVHFMAKVIRQLVCKRCGKKWLPRRFDLPKACPGCKRYDWNEEGGYDLKKELKKVKALLPKRVLVVN